MEPQKKEYYALTKIYSKLLEAVERFEMLKEAHALPKLINIWDDEQEAEIAEPIEAENPITLLIFLVKFEEFSDSPFTGAPYWLQGNIAITTYEQFKLYILKFNPWDIFDPKTKKLTYLALFVEEYLDKELNNSGKRHLVALIKQLEVDLRIWQEFYWEQLKEKILAFPSSENISEAIQQKLDDINEFIDRNYQEKKEICSDWNAFLAEKEAIVKNLEIRLNKGSYRFLSNPNLFLSTTSNTSHNSNNITNIGNTIVKNIVQDQKKGKDWTNPYEEIDNGNKFELPIKSEIAENINEWGAQRANLTKDQTSNHKQTGVKINEIDRLDTLNTDNTELIDSTQINKGDGDSSTSSEAFSVSLLNWMDEYIEKYLNYEDILTKLDRHFKPIWLFGC